ncbi:SET domain-containing protein [Metschnikowia bicuspidata var. bicuspidata NRRL YB-4993]|uniref:SET domain-containing protein n=1 Tax=Metschnikowia bicuspidata var. bicuspidata NRRL YB-4993 TaxID=869754 RepID=A0A1A0H6C2_9ASCO|nr:SET domain-containing protein [Metschnikowia bicuspidata var. bicuspidata NRRL YB-4993]OBA19463.1 SET domain-containing protein [Metschnikowia bicuspidata var. bicuspidata NRRL YB-4993]
MHTADFLGWAGLRGVQMHLSVEVRASGLGGVGIFARTTADEDAVVLRVPRSCVFDLRNFFQLAEKLKAGDATQLAAAILNAALHAGGPASESVIIRSFVWGLFMLRQKRRLINVPGIEQIDAYLQVLATTPTLDIEELAEEADAVEGDLRAEKRLVERDFARLASDCPEAGTLMSLAQAFQLHQAVKSRVLEIPQAEPDLDDYDYCTNISLVPVLDFANHAHANNAVFDVDPESNDVILRLVARVPAGTEITICYDPANAVEPFLKTYGFVPKGPCTAAWPIPDLDASLTEAVGGNDYSAIAKWLQVRPELPIRVDAAGAVAIDSANLRLPLLLIPGLAYYRAWATETADIAREFGETEEETADIIAELRRQETHAPVVQASDTVFGVTWHDSYISLSHILEQTGTKTERAVLELATRTAEVIRRIAHGPGPGGVRGPEQRPGAGGPLGQYRQLQAQISDRLSRMSAEEITRVAHEAVENLLR